MPKDLVVLVADKDTEYAVKGLLSRPAALGIRPIEADIFPHWRRDPGCANEAHDFLRPLLHLYGHALVMFDRIGSGKEQVQREAVSEEVRSRVAANGWGDRAGVVVLDPEIEVWVFAASPQVERCLAWPATNIRLRHWLSDKGLWARNDIKPRDPKTALEQVLREIRRPKSPAFFECLGRLVNFGECTDPSFLTFRQLLAHWFPGGR